MSQEVLLKRFYEARGMFSADAPPDTEHYREALWETVRYLMGQVQELQIENESLWEMARGERAERLKSESQRSKNGHGAASDASIHRGRIPRTSMEKRLAATDWRANPSKKRKSASKER